MALLETVRNAQEEQSRASIADTDHDAEIHLEEPAPAEPVVEQTAVPDELPVSADETSGQGMVIECQDRMEESPASCSNEIAQEERTTEQAQVLISLPEDADKDLISEFVTECGDLLEGAEAALLSLETDPENMDSVNMVFRTFHTIKGTSGFLGLIHSRLMKRLRLLGFTDFTQYIDHLENDATGTELSTMIDALTTNQTSFFRESHHFDFFRSHLLPTYRNSRDRVLIWSAGCSTGAEPFSLAVLLREDLSETRLKNCKILATDISHRVLETARNAVYSEDALKSSYSISLKKYIKCVQTKPERLYQISDDVRSLVRFAYLNLADAWPMKGPFDTILCRNVMIYFDIETRKRLVHRFWEMLKPGGYLFVGHSESLNSTNREFRYVEPAIYLK